MLIFKFEIWQKQLKRKPQKKRAAKYDAPVTFNVTFEDMMLFQQLVQGQKRKRLKINLDNNKNRF